LISDTLGLDTLVYMRPFDPLLLQIHLAFIIPHFSQKKPLSIETYIYQWWYKNETLLNEV